MLINQSYLDFHFHRRTAMASTGKFVSLLKQGLNEIPEVIAAGIVGLSMGGIAVAKVYYDSKQEGYGNKKYKFHPVYMRPDDPRAAKVHKM